LQFTVPKPVDEVACAFWSQGGLIERDIRIPTGNSARAERLRIACQDFAFEHGCVLWVQPNLWPTPIPGKPWIIFGYDRRARRSVFVDNMPSVEAGEMWMIHHGHKYR
jgi:hypothetical protein